MTYRSPRADRTPPDDGLPVTEDELHAWVDGQLPAGRHAAVQAHLARHPAQARRVAQWQAQRQGLQALFEPVLRQAPPARLRVAADGRPAGPRHARSRWTSASAAVLLLCAGALAGWQLHAHQGVVGGPDRLAGSASGPAGVAEVPLPAYARRAAVAHAVFAADARRAVEIGAEQQDQLQTWLSRRLGTPVRAARLQDLGYRLEGGRLLPGERGPVAQFMYRDDAGRRLTLYATNDLPPADAGPAPGALRGFQFGRAGAVQLFFWVDGRFGYALAVESPPGQPVVDDARDTLARLAAEVHRQLAP